MKNEIINTLKKASDSGEPVSIVYHGGTQPGTVRNIFPLNIALSEVKARDVATNQVKLFKLSKIQLPHTAQKYQNYTPDTPADNDPENIKQAFAEKTNSFESLGWLVKLEQNDISLYSFFKNGKPRKSPDIRLSYVEFTNQEFYDCETDDFAIRQKRNTRPFQIYSKSFAQARKFKSIAAAVATFEQEAQTIAPKKQ